MSEATKVGTVETDGRNVTIFAPAPIAGARAVETPPPSPAQLVGVMLRHLKGVMTAGEELQRQLAAEEKERPNNR